MERLRVHPTRPWEKPQNNNLRASPPKEPVQQTVLPRKVPLVFRSMQELFRREAFRQAQVLERWAFQPAQPMSCRLQVSHWPEPPHWPAACHWGPPRERPEAQVLPTDPMTPLLPHIRR